MRSALITGVAGQTGSYLAEYLLSLGYRVTGVVRRTSQNTHETNLRGCLGDPAFRLAVGDVTDPYFVLRTVEAAAPDELYNLAAQSHVAVSFDEPCHTTGATYLGALNCLEAVRCLGGRTRVYQASSSEMFGSSCSLREGGVVRHTTADALPPDPAVLARAYQDEQTPMLPNSPYAVAKLAAHHLCRIYRGRSVFACSGVLYNHESPRRGPAFVTRKIVRWAAAGRRGRIRLGNLDAWRDWGHARDYVVAMHAMLQRDEPGDYVVATGHACRVRDFLRMTLELCGVGVGEGPEALSPFCEVDPALLRPCEVPYLRGDASRARDLLGWRPRCSLAELILEMLDAETQIHGAA